MNYFKYWTQDIRKDGVPYPKFAEWFGHDEIGMRDAKEICRRNSIELRYWTDDMPPEMVEENEALEVKHLERIGRPPWHGTDRWKMIGAFDTEDGEICLMYARPLENTDA
ncbi:hypothetical protein [Acetobacter sp. UBA5411]|uniref:hypothetical protein n=1 Tax=Acetobacter sp. UBA5411 TaxID=1945905 RepID=UPI0025BEAF94|nr:hypothetical protein [Acetobacter sp. UBA5411]